MWFWSVSWSTNCPVYFSLFLVDQKKICSVSGNFWSGSDFFGQPNFFLVHQKFPETDKKFPETGQFFLVGQKKMRKRPNNWLTKRLTKTTWTGLKETDQKYMDAAYQKWPTLHHQFRLIDLNYGVIHFGPVQNNF